MLHKIKKTGSPPRVTASELRGLPRYAFTAIAQAVESESHARISGRLNHSTDENIKADDISHVDVETYRIAAEHAHTGWDDYASAQLSFPYLMGLAARYRGIKVAHFSAETRNDPAFAEFAKRLTITAPAEIDGLYPKLRPARVTVTTQKGKFTRQADEALGSRIVPLDDAGLEAKFIELVGPVLGDAHAKKLVAQFWDIEGLGDIRPLVDSTTQN